MSAPNISQASEARSVHELRFQSLFNEGRGYAQKLIPLS